MLKISESLNYLDDPALFSDAYNGTPFNFLGTSKGDPSDISFTDKILLVSYVEFDSGWSWLYNLINLHNTFAASPDVFIIAIVFKNSPGNLNATLIRNQITNDPVLKFSVSGIDFYTIPNFFIAPDNNDSPTSLINKYAVIYSNYILNDAFFNMRYAGGKMYSYLADKDKIVDKWHTNCESFTIANASTTAGSNVITVSSTAGLSSGDSVTESGIPIMSYITFINSATQFTINNYVTTGGANVTLTIGSGDPHSFHRMGGVFNSRDFSNTETFLNQRITNLLASPVITQRQPAESSLLTTLPKSWITFSKLMDYTAANTAGKYNVTPTGGGTIHVTNADFTGRNQIENVVELTLSGSLSDGPLTITVDPTVTDTASNAITGGNVVNYTIDVTGPTVSITHGAGVTDPTSLNPIPMILTISDTVSGVPDYDLDDLKSKLELTEGNWSSISTLTKDSISSSLNQYSFTVTPAHEGTVTVTMAADQVADNVGNLNSAASYSIVYQAPVAKKRDIVLVMDTSGSMGSNVTIGATAQSKIEYTKEAARVFIDKWAVWNADPAAPPDDPTVPDDRYGMVTYSSQALKQTAALEPILGDSPTPGVSNAQAAKNIITGLSAGGLTAMGSGIGNALNLVNYIQADDAYGRKRFGILFADGQQNVDPLINFSPSASPSSLSITAAPGGAAGWPAGMTDVALPLAGRTMPVYTISIGNNPGWTTTLQNISTVTGATGYPVSLESIWPDVEVSMEQIITSIYKNNSPQVVFRQSETLAAGSSDATFQLVLNRSITKVMISLSWLGNEKLSIALRNKVLPGRVIIISNFDETVDENNHCIKLLRFPFVHTVFVKPNSMHKIIKVFPSGKWEVVVRRKNPSAAMPAVSFNLSVIGDEKKISVSEQFVPGMVFTGTLIPVGIKVSDNITNLRIADVKVRRPETAFGNILDKYKRNISSPVRPLKENTPVSEIINKLYNHPAAGRELRKVKMQTIQLQPANKDRVKGKARKLYKGMYKNVNVTADIPGVYKLDYKIQGSSKEGDFERSLSSSILVVARPDIAKSRIAVSAESSTSITLRVAPADKSGNLLGPGYSDSIRILIRDKPAGIHADAHVVNVNDNFDSSYTGTVKKRSSIGWGDLHMSVDILGETIFTGKISLLVNKDKADMNRQMILTFINNVKSPAELVSRVKDTPGIGYHKGKYGRTIFKGKGLTLAVAKLILRERNSRGGFKTLEEIDKIKGVGRDTFADIMNMFSKRSGHDRVRRAGIVANVVKVITGRTGKKNLKDANRELPEEKPEVELEPVKTARAKVKAKQKASAKPKAKAKTKSVSKKAAAKKSVSSKAVSKKAAVKKSAVKKPAAKKPPVKAKKK